MQITWDYHIHSIFSDGENSIDEIAEYAVQVGLKEIAITDHVRENLTYHFSDLINQVKKAEQKYKISIKIGAEAKILPNGKLDMPKSVNKYSSFIIGSVHSWPDEIPLERAYDLLFISHATILGHPKIVNAAFLQKCIKYKKVLEINYHYQLSKKVLSQFKNYPDLRVAFGSNAHKLSDIRGANNYFSQIVNDYISLDQVWRVS